MLLVFYDRESRTHLRDFIDVGLIDSDWPAWFPELLRERLEELLDHPEG
ncbi:hypothetical protein SH661x_004404 [Planctomicrobium sp. SH661]